MRDDDPPWPSKVTPGAKNGTAISIEGLSPDELLALLAEENEALLVSGQPIVFQAGSARILGQFSRDDHVFYAELAHIDGGGEGVIPTLVVLAQRYARAHGLRRVEWLVYATNCAKPNPKLRRVLERKGFVVREIPGKGPCYYRALELR